MIESIVVALILSTASLSLAATTHAQLNGMTVFGYQAWYPIYNPSHQPQDYPNSNDFKWFSPSNVVPGPPNPPKSLVLTDTLPYVDDYPQECWEDTNFILRNGSHAKFFNSFCPGVIEAHFKYMVQYKIDGVFVQRFFNAATPSDPSYNATLQALQTIRQMAEKYGKYFAVEYDLSGPGNFTQNDYLPTLTNDYNNVVKPLFNSSSYIYNGTRPVLQVYGMGINNGTGLTGPQYQDLFTRYKSTPENPYMIAGVPWYWIDFKNPTHDPNGFWSAFQSADCLQGWPVGAYSSIDELRYKLNTYLLQQKAQTDSWGINFSGAFTPGGSNRNALAYNKTLQGPYLNRFNGTFYEEELKLFTNTTLKPWFNFGAMFDEYTEGTQILPMIQYKDLPSNPNPGFAGSDDDKSVFYYMQLSGQYTAALHKLWGQAPLSP